MTAPTDFVYRAMVVQYAPTDGPDYNWANVHEFTGPPGLLGDRAATQAIAVAFAAFHRSMLNARFGVDRVVLSTYGPDLPFPPGFVVENFRQQGTGPSYGPPLPLSVVLFMRREVQRGRDGKLFLRGFLSEGMLNGEELRVETGRDIPGYVNGRGAALIENLDNAGVTLVLASGPVAAVQTRPVLTLRAVNARSLQYRTRRKTRFQQNALESILGTFGDGSISPSEIPTLIEALRRLFPGRGWPELPPPPGA